MATPHLNLDKISSSGNVLDFIDIFNDNMDKLDASVVNRSIAWSAVDGITENGVYMTTGDNIGVLFHRNYDAQAAEQFFKPLSGQVVRIRTKISGSWGGWFDVFDVVCNANLLDNPWFTVNQRKASTWSSGYGVDRWKVVSGSATVNADGTVTVNGTLRQILEQPVGAPFTASVLCSSGTAVASYDDTTKQFNITSNGGHVKCAKLEVGGHSTIGQEVKPDYAVELLKCKRFYEVIFAGDSNMTLTGCLSVNGTSAYGDLVLAPKRAVPSIGALDSLKAGRASFGTNITKVSLSGDPDSGHFSMQLSGSFDSSSYYRLGVLAGGFIEFSADL